MSCSRDALDRSLQSPGSEIRPSEDVFLRSALPRMTVAQAQGWGYTLSNPWLGVVG